MLFGKQITAAHAASSSALSLAAFTLTGEVLRDLAALASFCVSAAAMFPTVRAWVQKAFAWVKSKLSK